MATTYVPKILERIEAKARELDGELSCKDLQILTDRLKFLWELSLPGTTEITSWRHKRSRQAYEEMQDVDCHLFLAVILSVNPTESGQTRFQAVTEYLRNLGQYEMYCFTPRASTLKALRDLADKPYIANNERYCRLMEKLSRGKYYYNMTSLY